MKTGGMGGPWVLCEKPKPRPVADRYVYWVDPPPERSERCAYWLRQIDKGWIGSRAIRREGYDSAAEWFGVYIWEYLNEISPALSRAIAERR